MAGGMLQLQERARLIVVIFEELYLQLLLRPVEKRMPFMKWDLQ